MQWLNGKLVNSNSISKSNFKEFTRLYYCFKNNILFLRCNFKAYCLFSFLNTIVYCIPAGWIWGDHGFLKNLGAVDIAGSGTVHLVGGTSGKMD